jgi:hypothetical protein
LHEREMHGVFAARAMIVVMSMFAHARHYRKSPATDAMRVRRRHNRRAC